MTGPEHYREAERLVVEARHLTGKRIAPDWLTPVEVLAEAQVHATLAFTAASVDGPAIMRPEDRDEWDRAMGRLEDAAEVAR